MKTNFKMKKAFKYLLLLVLTTRSLFAQTFSDKDIVERSFPVKPNTTVEVNNKYGRVNVKPWDKDSVKFVIELNLSSNNLARLQKTRNSIGFSFNASSYYVTATTDFGPSANQIMTELKGLSDALVPGKNTIDIHYTVYCPEAINLTVINKFGDLYIDDLRGMVRISLANGNMKVNSISGEAQIDLSFGNGTINYLSDGRISASYSDLTIKSAEKLNIDSKSSTLNIQDSDLLRINSRRDKLRLGTISEIQGTTNFSQIWIENLSCRIILGMKFGNLNLEKIDPEFCEVNLNSEFTDIELGMIQGTDYEAVITRHRDGSVSLPATETERITLPGNESLVETTFRRGNAKNYAPLRIMATQKCYIGISEK